MAYQQASAAPLGARRDRGAARAARIFFGQVWVLRILSILAVFALWEWAGRVPVSPAFPTFGQTLSALGSLLADGSLVAAFAETIQPMIIGLLICSVLAVTFGIGMGLSRGMEWFSLPVFVVLQAAPMAAIIPLVTFIYGIGLGAKILAVVIMSAPIIVLNSYKGIRNVHPSLLEMSASFQASRLQQIVKIILPSASGIIFAGLRLGFAQGLTGAILAELLITPTGLGDLITYYRSVAGYPQMFAVILSIVVFASVSITLFQKLETVLFRPEQRAS